MMDIDKLKRNNEVVDNSASFSSMMDIDKLKRVSGARMAVQGFSSMMDIKKLKCIEEFGTNDLRYSKNERNNDN